MDIAIRHPDKPGAFILGIECDGASYHSAKSARDRDRLRQMILEIWVGTYTGYGLPTGSETVDAKSRKWSNEFERFVAQHHVVTHGGGSRALRCTPAGRR